MVSVERESAVLLVATIALLEADVGPFTTRASIARTLGVALYNVP